MTKNELLAWMNTTENATSIARAKSSFGSLQHASESLPRSLSCARQNDCPAPKPNFTIWPEYGRSFLWVNTAGTSQIRGGSHTVIAEKMERGISKSLMRRLADWQLIYECNAYESTEEGGCRPYDWKTFHRVGTYLAVQLKEELGDRARVFYEKPMEDPNGHLNQRREVFVDGQLGGSE